MTNNNKISIAGNMMTLAEVYAIEPDDSWWRKLPNNRYVEIGSWAEIETLMGHREKRMKSNDQDNG